MGLTGSSVYKLIPARFTLESLNSLFADYPRQDFRVRLWDGTVWGAAEHPRFTLILKHPAALRRIVHSPSELSLGEAYIFDELDVEGDLQAAFEVGDYLIAKGQQSPSSAPLLAKLLSFPEPKTAHDAAATLHGAVHSRERDRQAVRYHYDLPSEFYRLWLDKRMLYSCAYFERDEDDLDTAQRRKLDYICKKLRLSPGDKLLDIGCGWGGLLVEAASSYKVNALGITLSVRQAEVARERIQTAGLNDHCRVEISDYRDLEFQGQFDRIASIGMFEHVGRSHYSEYFSRAWELLKPGGVFLNSGISASATYKRVGPSFIDRYVFPDGDLVPLSAALVSAEACGFEIRDVESLREHYALTLDHWVRRLEERSEEAERIVGQTTYRIWRLYMAASAHAFRNGRLNLYHTVLVKPLNGRSCMPLTRADWYRDQTRG
jgi:cyclopropane-fatty-acyl-phospholipid synthase